MIKVENWDAFGEVKLADGRYVDPRTGKASRKTYVRTTYGSGTESWAAAEISAEELAELAGLYVQHLAAEAEAKKAAEEERRAKQAAKEASPEYQAKRKEAIASVRRFFTAAQVADAEIPSYITMQDDEQDICIYLFGE